MKKLLLLIFIFQCYAAIGQGTGFLYMVPKNCHGSTIRLEPTSGKHIVYSPYYSSNIEHHFSLTDMVTDIDVWFNGDYSITDFEIIDDYVVFCGQSFASSVSGMVGWFNIDSLFFFGSPVYIEKTLLTLGLESLDNIEVFKDMTGQIHIVGYGKTSSPIGGSGNYYRAFEAIGNLPGLFNWRASDLWRLDSHSDIVDMAVTENYIVLLEREKNIATGYLSTYGLGITLMPFPKYNMLSSTSMTAFFFQTVTYNNYPGLNNPDYDEPFNTEPKMTCPQRDEIAIFSARSDFDPNDPYSYNGSYYLVNRIYDVGPYMSGNPITMISASMTPIPGSSEYIVDIKYDAQTKNYIVLHRPGIAMEPMEYAVTTMDFSSGSSPTFVISDYQTSYNTSNYWVPWSMCLDGSLNYTVSGFKYYTYELILWQNLINTIDGSCNKSIQNPLVPLDLMVAKELQSKVNLYGWRKISVAPEPVMVSHFPCHELCNPNN